MRHIASLVLLLPALVFGADKDFNGRWDITVNDASKRVWWMQVTGAGTPSLAGEFVGFPGGQMDPIRGIALQNGELTFQFKGHYRGWEKDALQPTGMYRARLADGKIHGTLIVDDRPNEVFQWTGVRAPDLAKLAGTTDPAAYRTGTPIELFNGRDLGGWQLLQPDKKPKWNVVNGIAKNEPDASDLVTDLKFWNFKLHAEYRLAPHSNSGIGLRGRYEIQIFDDAGEAPSKHSNGALYSRYAPSTAASKPAGEWQTFDITLIGNVVTVVLNGTTILDRKEIEGLTAIAIDANEAEPGPIVVQGDHGAVEFRKLTLTPLLDGKVSMGHLHINSAEITAMTKFWTDVMGGTPMKLGRMDGVRFPDTFVFFNPVPATGGTIESTVQHVGFKVKDLKTYTDRLTAAGVKFEANQNGRQAMVTGPENIRIELTQDETLTAPIANHHIHFYTPSVEQTRSWYVSNFGAVAGRRGPFLAADLAGVNLTFSEAKAGLPMKGRALDHIGFEVKDLESFCKALEQRGIKFDIPYRQIPSLGLSIAFLTDPWGTYVELTEGLNKL